MRSKVSEWLRRYLPAEICAFAGALIAGLAAHYFLGNTVVTALAGTWGDNIGYYSRILFTDIRERKQCDEKVTVAGMLKVLRNAFVEFGPAEYFDSFLIRPLVIYFFLRITDNLPVALFLGKICADVTFYIPTIISYEFRKKYLKD